MSIKQKKTLKLIYLHVQTNKQNTKNHIHTHSHWPASAHTRTHTHAHTHTHTHVHTNPQKSTQIHTHALISIVSTSGSVFIQIISQLNIKIIHRRSREEIKRNLHNE